MYIYISFNFLKNIPLLRYFCNSKFVFIYFVMRNWGSEKLYTSVQHHTGGKQNRWDSQGDI